MKKLLSILSAIGLVATASTSVVSCTKTSELPTYHDVSDISGDYLSDNQALEKDDLQDDAINEGHVLATIANTFRNPSDLIDEAKELEIAKTGNDQIYDGYKIVNLVITKTVSDKDGKETKTNSQVIRMKVSDDDTYFKTTGDDVKQFELDFVKASSMILSTLNNEVSLLKNTDKNKVSDFIEIESKGSALMSMDQWMFNQLSALQVNKIPGFQDNVPEIRYESINQQIVASYSKDDLTKQKANGFADWKNILIEMNKKILNHLNEDITKNKIDLDTISKDILSSLNIDGKSFFTSNLSSKAGDN